MRLDGHLIRAATPFLNGERPTFATTLVFALIRAYGPEFLNWDPCTLEMEIQHDFNVRVPRVQMAQILALSGILTSDRFYQDVQTFDQVVNALSCADGEEEQDIPAVEDVLWAVTEAGLSDPDHVGQFSDGIRRYCGVVLADEGFVRAPMGMSFAIMAQHPVASSDDPSGYSDAYTARDSQVKEVEQWLSQQINKLLHDISELGVSIEPAQLRQALQESEPLTAP